MAQAITQKDVKKAAAELEAMRGSLRRWLSYRATNDRVLAGTAKLRKPVSYAQRVVATRRDMAAEQDLAQKLYELLSVTLPDVQLPNADVSANPNAAPQLAMIAITGQAPGTAAPALSGVTASHPWLWPVLIVGGLVIMVTTAIKSAADIAAQKEQDACIEAGACTDYGFFLKAGGIAALVWLAWKEFGPEIRALVKRRS